MTEEMTLKELEVLSVKFGRDLESWPDSCRPAAEALAATPEGQQLMKANNAVDHLIEAARAMGPETASDGNSDAFVDRLMDIPVYHHQKTQAKKSRQTILWMKDWFENASGWLSTARLASQAAAFAAVLVVGMYVGMNSQFSAADSTISAFDTVDIGDALFASSLDYSLDEQ